MIPEIGRLPLEEVDAAQGILHDAPEKQVAAMLTKMDQIIDAIVALDAANTGVPEVAALKKLVLHL